jgi:hypothetical protein
MHRHIHPQTRKGTSYDPAREVKILRFVKMSEKKNPSKKRLRKWRRNERDGLDKKDTHCLRPTQRLLRGFDASFPVDAHAADRLEALVCQHKDSAVVCLEVVDLFAEEQRPEVFADEFDVV